MPEFYVTFDRGDVHYLGIVIAPERPQQLVFSDYESVRDTMDALGHSWEFKNEIEDPEQKSQRSTAWLERMSTERALKPSDKPIEDLLTSSGGGDSAAFGNLVE